MLRPQLTSVIIPVFNDVAGIARTLEGLCRQSWPMDGIEVIVVDNGSEQPVSLSAQYPFHVQVIRCQTPGSYAARNAGAAVAKGEIFAFTDADCIPCQDWLEQGIALLLEGGGKWAVGGEVVFTRIESPSGVALYQMLTGFGQESNILTKGFAATANLFCTKAQFEEVGPFDERLLSGGDREWAWRANTLHISMTYQPDAIVYTEPRRTLLGAIRQARRVVAGRAGLRKLGVAHIGDAAVAKQRSALESVMWILAQRELNVGNRLRVLSVAILIRGAAGFESVRLALGTTPERR